ncbi:telomere-binding alpha subunit central domain protein [Aspergillus homomorphus CBS 101889]|uniref:Protection of telomeres protein 1 n=1 Tax=Aspergillus homomorphus (strain CBS 101889) TaxID=1450537 RepID=A0A395I563_ASPHC|nr:hypothetical protein BO97DRAFT_403953 [Aspergillus homomorphus CBS 101889]RAL14925.1 hypothetical protein BO97DRAFT_403953 [Aspergillus homomorphus CBS 101889]
MPANFIPRLVDISKALASPGNVNIIGVVVDVMPGVWKSRGSSTCVTFTVKDSNLENGHTWDGLKVKYFRDNENSLPPVQVHDVILLRNLWVRSLQGGTVGVAAQDKDIPWAIFRPDPDPVARSSPICGPQPFEPDNVERRKALYLLDKITSIHDFRKAAVASRPPPPYVVQTSAPNSRSYNRKKFSLIKDIQEQTFVDLVGEVIKMYPNDSEKVLLYLTDYTANKDLHDYSPDQGEGNDGCEGDTFGYQRRFRRKWTGPAGQLSLPVTLWEPHASYARQFVKENDVILVYNVHIRKSRINGGLEAVVHTNKTHPLSANVLVVQAHKDVRAQQLIERKTEYWESNSRKRKPSDEDKSKAPKKSKVKARKKEKPEESQKPLSPPVTNRSRYEANPTVRAGNPSVPIRSLEAIVASEEHTNLSPDNIEYRFPFQNFCYRSKVRVVDYFPPRLEDFSVPVGPAPANEESDREEDSSFTTWEWRFCLLVESVPPPPPGQPKQQVRLFVSGPDAVYLHGLDAVDLRKNSADLSDLREKLFHLWGNLEELKQAATKEGNGTPPNLGALSQQPFNCCIKEYGVTCRHRVHTLDSDDDTECTHEDCFGWEKRFAMFMTTIEA